MTKQILERVYIMTYIINLIIDWYLRTTFEITWFTNFSFNCISIIIDVDTGAEFVMLKRARTFFK